MRGDEYVVKIRDKEIRTKLDLRVAVGHARSARCRCRASRIDGEMLRLLLQENVPGSFPYTAGVFAFKREGEDPTRMFAGEGDAFRTNQPLQARLRRHAGAPPVHRLRFGHALRLRPGSAPGHLRQGRQFRRVDRDARRHEGAVRRLRPVRADDLGVDDHQRPGADHPGDVHEHRHRPAGGEVPAARTAANRPRTKAQKIKAWTLVDRARHGAGRHPEGRPGPEHLHLLDRVRAQDDGRHPGIFRAPQGAEFLFGVDLRLSHRRGRRESDLPARLHARQRLHLRRVLPGARHAHRRFRAEPVVLLLQRHGPGIHGDRPRRAPHLGGGDEEQIRRQRAQPEAEVPRPDLGPLPARAGDGLQRHPHHAAGADRHLRQLQQPAHQRL